ncbi:tRNA lysidine(34) synthetase TilS [Rhizobium sp. XQZ8]|uniref:tRNA lysidine(34) synthetase TilS n=1 Tax=Rhizobium populisoli TaxID=2859785 RepID=UPI001CA5432B|nr:tRNA lysidine(34) synthetase TilS [Rhizobium populisoli]MBW6421514.1 tRNA lysidine(34) synthetase TilS [Rhizobium populisoli]
MAISGGSDSAGLLLALVQANASDSDVFIDAVTIDHALRPESADEAVSVAAFCRRLGVRHFIRRWDGEKPRTGISAASREARYRLLMDVADEIDATAILTGHTLDDQAETVAMRAARNEGEGNLGLAGMADAVLLDRRRWLLRPFLHCRRADIRELLAEVGEGWIDDPSNQNIRYERVRVRERLSQEAVFDDHAIIRAGLRRTELSDAASLWVRSHLAISHGVLAHVSGEGLTEDPVVLRHALAVLSAVLGGRSYLPAGESMDRVMAFIDGGQPGRMTVGRVIFDLRRDGLYVVRENRGMIPLHIAADSSAVWDGRYRIVNDGECEIAVGPLAPGREEAIGLFPDVPPAIAMRAATAMPCIEIFAGRADGAASPSPQRGEGGPKGRMRGPSAPTSLSSGIPRSPLIASHSLGTSPRWGEVGANLQRGIPSLTDTQEGEGAPRSVSPKPRILLTPTLGPFDRFLPQFDVNLANQFVLLLGCDDFPPLPIKDCARKS